MTSRIAVEKVTSDTTYILQEHIEDGATPQKQKNLHFIANFYLLNISTLNFSAKLIGLDICKSEVTSFSSI